MSQQTLNFRINNLLHDGRGVAVYTADSPTHPTDKCGKKVFVSFALPDEVVKVKLVNSRKSFEEGDCIEVIEQPNPQRQEPLCQHFGTCGGCSLQHWQTQQQIRFKQSVLAEKLQHQAGTQPNNWLEPIVAEQVGYRTKARIGIRYLSNGQLVLGFRERSSNRLVDIHHCPILDNRVGNELNNLRALIASLSRPDAISHLEVAMGDTLASKLDNHSQDVNDVNHANVAIIIRHLKPFNHQDLQKLRRFFDSRGWYLYLQNKKSASSIRFVSAKNSNQSVNQAQLDYQLPDFDLVYRFAPNDFTQVNMSVNQQMVSLACQLLDLQEGERVLDLFSGLGNFSLAMAKVVGGAESQSGLVVGVEGSTHMTQRAKDNAQLNQLNNTQFVTHDLTQDLSTAEWAHADFDAVLIDPPRAGAREVMAYIDKFNAKRIVYISCNPATLARDSKLLIEAGYRMTDAGVMDMFCHTGHVESIAKFDKLARIPLY